MEWVGIPCIILNSIHLCQDVDLYGTLVEKLSKFGEVMTPFVADKTITHLGSEHPTGIGLVFLENGFIRIFFCRRQNARNVLAKGIICCNETWFEKIFSHFLTIF